MNSTVFRMPARRPAAVAAALALAAGPLALAAPAHATGGEGRASAVVLRTGLDVSLLDKTVNVPLAVTLNEVQAPASAGRTALSARLDGVDGGRPFSVLRADVATARATADDRRAEGHVTLADAKVHLPGLPLLSLVQVEKVTSRAVCAAGERPVAESEVPGRITVLGKRVTLTAGGTTRVAVPAVGEVTLALSKTATTSRTAASTALSLTVSVNPLNLNVADVTGTVTLAEATCTSPGSAPAPATGEPTPEAPETPDAPETPAAPVTAPPRGNDAKPQTAAEPTRAATAGLAETGGSSATPYVVGGALALLAAGAGALVLTRRSRARG